MKRLHIYVLGDDIQTLIDWLKIKKPLDDHSKQMMGGQTLFLAIPFQPIKQRDSYKPHGDKGNVGRICVLAYLNSNKVMLVCMKVLMKD